jgi:hypothetical protein
MIHDLIKVHCFTPNLVVISSTRWSNHHSVTSASSDVTRELVRMWLRHADYSMLCNVWGGDLVGHISSTKYFDGAPAKTLKVVCFGVLLSTPQRRYWNPNTFNLYIFANWFYILPKKFWKQFILGKLCAFNFRLFFSLKIHGAATFFLVDLLSNNFAYDI